MPLQISDFTIKKAISLRAAPTVNHILSATAHLLERGALHEFSTNAIAIKAGYAVATIYKYFPNKIAIVQSLVIRELNNRMEESLLEMESIVEKPVEYYLENLVNYFELKNLNRNKLNRRLLFSTPVDNNVIKDIILQQELYIRKIFDVIENNAIDCPTHISDKKIKIFSSLFFSFIRKSTILSDVRIDMEERSIFIKSLLMIIKS